MGEKTHMCYSTHMKVRLQLGVTFLLPCGPSYQIQVIRFGCTPTEPSCETLSEHLEAREHTGAPNIGMTNM